MEILACLSSSKFFMSWKWAEPSVSARSCLCGLFQLFRQTLKIGTFTRQWTWKHTTRPPETPAGRFLQKRQKITILAPFSAIKPYEPCPKWPNHPYGIKRHFAALKPGNLPQNFCGRFPKNIQPSQSSPQGKLAEYICANPFPRCAARRNFLIPPGSSK